MVEQYLPISPPSRLKSMFMDLNAYFASCEQQLDPSLRGRPLIVAPTAGDNTSAIAASYEAKRFGIKTGTNIGLAKQLCPDVVIVKGNHAAYTAFHKRIVEVCESVLPVDKVCSIDEMRFRLLETEAPPAVARELALKMKKAIRENVGECMTASFGIATNHFLAKTATDMMKPDGLVILTADDIPSRLYELKLTDFCGINKRMKARLNAAGVFSSRQLLDLSPEEMRRAFGSVCGERYWFNLHGYEVDYETRQDQSLSHSHVLPPDLRTEEGAREVMMRLAHKATARLRANKLWATHMGIYVKGMRKSWKATLPVPPCQDSVTVTSLIANEWPSADFERPLQVGIVFTGLLRPEYVTPSLFDQTPERAEFSHAVDKMNHRFGKHSVFVGGMGQGRNSAEERIAFQKVELFVEGADDHAFDIESYMGGERLDTWRGVKR
jgi:DNA polymerase IV